VREIEDEINSEFSFWLCFGISNSRVISFSSGVFEAISKHICELSKEIFFILRASHQDFLTLSSVIHSFMRIESDERFP